MLQSISDLEKQLQAVGAKLALYHAAPEQVIKAVHEQQPIQAVFINRDYTPFSRRRDDKIHNTCKRLGITLHCLPDILLTGPEQVVKSDHTPYKVFTAFYNKVRQYPVALPQALAKHSFASVASGFKVEQLDLSDEETSRDIMPGGRNHALAILNQLADYADYQKTRDFPARDATSKLSAHLKSGACSIREVYYAITAQLGSEHSLLRQLYWRDFFTHIAYHFPHVFGRAFLEKFAELQWDNNQDLFQAWREGKTGFPIVDAGMGELNAKLNATGFMHNRARMIAASFLVKYLHIDWRWGERYFAQHLIDYDPCVNNGNWQWAASTVVMHSLLRIFNPWLQQQKFDSDCRYIYHWLPELKEFFPETLHRWHKKHSVCNYPAPVIDHARESQIAKSRFKKSITMHQ